MVEYRAILPISFRVTSLTVGKSYDLTIVFRASEVIPEDMRKYCLNL